MQTDLVLWVIVWFISILLLLGIRLQRRVAGSGLVFAYIFQFSLLHYPGALVYLAPWYSYGRATIWFPGFTPDWVYQGFRLSTYGLISFILGSIFLAPFLIAVIFRSHQTPPVTRIPDPRLGKAYMLVGILSYFILTPLVGKIPTLNAVLSSGLNLVGIGLILTLWRYWQERKVQALYRWVLLGTAGPPILTMMTLGFVSYGVATAVFVLSFLVMFFRPRWKFVVILLGLTYVGLSSYVTYMKERALIRQVVWGKESAAKRFQQFFESAKQFEWFDAYNDDHLWQIDRRLNQNILVGAAIEQLERSKGFVRGETFLAALLAVIPRGIWPDKPVRAGGNVLAARFTGMKFDETTSVGIGQVMEFYANFGVEGVWVGFLILGALITAFDLRAREYLLAGDWQSFALWYLPGMAFIQVSGNFVEVAGSAGAGLVMAVVLNRLLERYRGLKIFLFGRSP